MGTTIGAVTETNKGENVIGFFRYDTVGGSISPFYIFPLREDAKSFSISEDDKKREDFISIRERIKTLKLERKVRPVWFHLHYPDGLMWPGLIMRGDDTNMIAEQISPYWKTSVVGGTFTEVEDCRVSIPWSTYFNEDE